MLFRLTHSNCGAVPLPLSFVMSAPSHRVFERKRFRRHRRRACSPPPILGVVDTRDVYAHAYLRREQPAPTRWPRNINGASDLLAIDEQVALLHFFHDSTIRTHLFLQFTYRYNSPL